jgi:hypothetical protein
MWVARRVARGVMVWRVAGLPPAKFAYWRRWLIPHVVLVATVLFCMTPGPVYLGFWASKPAIESARRQALAGQTQPRIRWVGVYPAMRPSEPPPFPYERYPHVVPVSAWGGFVYDPRVGPAREQALQPVGGGWYVYVTGGAYP